ncbi:MAG: Flp pilus assembly protein CpaB [Acidimicrobiales bacterium]|nr:Flp pilus assembly protein CpaB [Hyphomonadaceae bacterium]RZV44356.1 MAG: Flp pilus assembly protein CpaB [Acidimicrobiales bacterium]
MDTKKLILVGVLGVVAVGAFLQLQKISTPAPVVNPVQAATPQPIVEEVNYVKVLVAALDVPMGTRVTPDHLQWTKWPNEALSENLIDDVNRPGAIEELNTAVARTAIYAGEPIVQRKLVLSGDRGQMSALLKPGMRAIATRISVDSAAGGFIKPGDRVDVVLTTQLKNEVQTAGPATNQYISKTVFENVHVLAIDQIFGDGPEGAATVVGSTALLELSQNDSEALIEAQSTGDLSLILRGLENRRVGFIPSAATVDRKETGQVTSMTIYRDGRTQQVAIQGQ